MWGCIDMMCFPIRYSFWNAYVIRYVIAISMLFILIGNTGAQVIEKPLYDHNVEFHDIIKETRPNPYRILATNAISVILDGFGDGKRDLAWIEHNSSMSAVGHASQALSILALTTIPINQHFTWEDWAIYITSYVITRFVLFDYSYNLARGLPLTYVGNSSIFDKILQEANGGDGFVAARGVSAAFVVSWTVWKW